MRIALAGRFFFAGESIPRLKRRLSRGTRAAARWEVAAELRRRLVDAFVAEGVRVPFPPHVA
jgi:hypothetical protein